MNQAGESFAEEVRIEMGPLRLPGTLEVPQAGAGVVLFAHGSGSSRFSSRNRAVAAALRRGGIGTLLFDLLTEEEAEDRSTVFDIPLLADRLGAATRWLAGHWEVRGWGALNVGYFGASTGGGAALLAAAGDTSVAAVVSRGGRPDLAGPALSHVQAPTLLIVGGNDPQVLELNRQALAMLRCRSELVVVPGATHLFEEPGTLEQVASLAQRWFTDAFSSHRDGNEA